MHDIVILAGGKADTETQEKLGVISTSELPWRGSTFLDHVHSVASEFTDPIVIGGPERPNFRQAPGGKSFVESLQTGASLVKSSHFLLITADLPFLKADSIRQFLSNTDPDAGWNYPIIPLELCKKEFPELPRTSLKLREGLFTGGNICLIEISAFQAALPIIQKSYDARKSPIKLGQIAGIKTLALILATKLIPHVTPIPALEKTVGKFLKSPAKAVITHAADIGTDIDSYSQYQAIIRGSES
jgi:hypothetical protein